ncbi:CBS domain-containing protein [Pseudalkalibacillus salsuginis]|uniref:CBS domain-containing protein n=1 Tax=Pseudalkalibacillus salsuginis TaxID=2910972 RepID=UPI001F2A880D|nr:CBS domain-containing protein [Pseudalkalibacillus salsuginis]MCF6408259.1 CBS domain-containing protein [Pseudalkalibacillus salsuginis]
MFVKSIMIPKIKTYVVQSTDNLKDVLHKLDQYQIDGMPVVTGNNKYAGIITLNRIYKAFFESGTEKKEFLSSTVAGDIADYKDDFINEEEIFEKILLSVQDRPLIAVVDESGDLKGVITRYDTLEQFQSAFGMKRKGVRISFSSSEAEGRIARLAEIAKQFHENIISLATFDETDKFIRRIVMKVEKQQNIDKFIRKLEASGFRVLDIKED